jgi:hypothetical protein
MAQKDKTQLLCVGSFFLSSNKVPQEKIQPAQPLSEPSLAM